MEKTSREKFEEQLRKAAYEPDYTVPHTMTKERLELLREERGYDETFDDFVVNLAREIGDEPEDPAELEEYERIVAACETLPGPIPDPSLAVAVFLDPPPRVSLFRRPVVKRILSLAAAFVIVFGVACSAVLFLDTPTVEAEKNRNKVVEEQGDTAVALEEPFAGEENVGFKMWETTIWEEVDKYRSFLSGLLIPDWVPEEYIFDCLYIEKYETGEYFVEYRFKKGDLNLYITQRPFDESGDALGLSEEGDAVSTAKGVLQVKENEDYMMGLIRIGEDTVRINAENSRLSDEELKQIVEGLN